MGSATYKRENPKHLGPGVYYDGSEMSRRHLSTRSQHSAVLLHQSANKPDFQAFGGTAPRKRTSKDPGRVCARASEICDDSPGLPHENLPRKRTARPFGSGVARFRQLRTEDLPRKVSNKPKEREADTNPPPGYRQPNQNRNRTAPIRTPGHYPFNAYERKALGMDPPTGGRASIRGNGGTPSTWRGLYPHGHPLAKDNHKLKKKERLPWNGSRTSRFK